MKIRIIWGVFVMIMKNKRGYMKFFLSFIDDYSRHCYLYLIHDDRSQSLTVFNNFKTKIRSQLCKKIKAVKFDRGAEYYS